MDDLISRAEAIRVASGYCHWTNIPKELAKLPSVNPKPCEDAISRQAAIELLNEDDPRLLMRADYRKMIEELPSVTPTPKKGRWIPVSERLPEDKQAVLVWCPQYKNIYCAYFEKEQWWIFGAFVQMVPNEVKAWMPLPQPYKGESEE